VETKAKPTEGWDISELDFQDDQVVGALTATFQITNELNALLSYGTAFRAPNIIERLFNGPTPEGIGYQILNPDLVSERSGNFDIGLKYRRNDAFMELVVFRNDIEDGIIQDFLSPAEVSALPQEVQDAIDASGARFVVQQRNVDRLRYEGAELALGYRAPFGLTVGGSYTYLDGERLGGTTILPPDDLYSDKLFAYARYAPDGSRWWAEYNLRYNGNASANVDPDEPPPPVGDTLPSFVVHNIGAGIEIATGPVRHDISLWIHNLTDELYAEFSNASFFRPEPGRSARIAYRLKF
jgi:outer membrane receptor protein involved in Fe transport